MLCLTTKKKQQSHPVNNNSHVKTIHSNDKKCFIHSSVKHSSEMYLHVCKYVKLVLNVQDIFMAGNDNNYYVSTVWVHRSVKTLSEMFLTAAILNNYANKLFTISYELRNRIEEKKLFKISS